MKKIIFFVVFISLILIYCSGSYSPPFTQEGEIHRFFKNMSDSLNIEALDPDVSMELISTKSFSVYNGDIMPDLFQQSSNYFDNIGALKEREDYIINLLKAFARQMGENQILLEKAREFDIDVPEDSVTARTEALYQQYGGKEEYVSLVDSLGLTEDFIINNIKDGLRIQSFIDQYILTEGLILDSELERYYSRDKTATVRHIFFLTQGKSESEKRRIFNRAQQVLGMARSGYDFAKLAEKYSQDQASNSKGGLYENIERGDMIQPFDRAAFSVPVGNISDIFESPNGFHIIKVIERKKEERPLEEVKDELINQLLQRKRGNALFFTLNYFKNEYGYQENFEMLDNMDSSSDK